MSEPKKPWGGRFEKSPSRFLDEFGPRCRRSPPLGRGHPRFHRACRMLAQQNIISEADADAIEAGLSEIYREIREGRFTFDVADEDIHMAIERVLTERIGPPERDCTPHARARPGGHRRADGSEVLGGGVGGGDGRPAQHPRSACRGALRRCDARYTHLQKAQPVLVSHHLLAYAWMLSRDVTAYGTRTSRPTCCRWAQRRLRGRRFRSTGTTLRGGSVRCGLGELAGRRLRS